MPDHHNHHHSSSTAVKKPQPPLNVPAGNVLFRLLCHTSRIGGVIGKSGSIIKNLQHETSAKIRIEDAPPGTDDRVISVVAPAALTKFVAGTEVSSAQEAVVRVFERIVDVAAETEGASQETFGVVSCRLLVEGRSIGPVIGKGGKIIQKITSDCCCKIRVLGHEKVPASALPDDEIIEFEGDILAVKKALVVVSCCIQDTTPGDKHRRLGNQLFEAIPKNGLPNGYGNVRPGQSAEKGPTVDPRPQQRDVVFKMLCSVDVVGGVIGKGGTIIRALQQETGALIVVGPPVHECLEQSIIISTMETSDLTESPAQNAVVRVYNRLIEAASEKGLDSGSSMVSARLLVSPYQVGCLLGKGGTIISDMRKATRTSIWIIADDEVPKCASESDRVVQITGEIINVRHALFVVTRKLRDKLFSSKLSNGVGTWSNPSMTCGINTHENSRDSPSAGFHTSASACQVSRHTNLTESMDHLRLNDNYDLPPSSSLLALQHTAAGDDSRSIGDGRLPAPIKGGIELGSGSRSAIVMNTTVEIVVPDNIISSVYGENGSNLTRLREISGAKVLVREPRTQTTDRIVVISGTPDETHAAQSLLQAFILTGQS